MTTFVSLANEYHEVSKLHNIFRDEYVNYSLVVAMSPLETFVPTDTPEHSITGIRWVSYRKGQLLWLMRHNVLRIEHHLHQIILIQNAVANCTDVPESHCRELAANKVWCRMPVHVICTPIKTNMDKELNIYLVMQSYMPYIGDTCKDVFKCYSTYVNDYISMYVRSRRTAYTVSICV